SLGATSHATFDSSLAAFRWLYECLSEKGYTNTNYLQDFKIKRPRLIKAEKNIRSYYEEFEMDFIYECLDDNRHLITDENYFIELRRDIRKGLLVDPQYYKAHYKVRRILQVVMDTGLRQGEVITLRKSALNGVVQLNKEIDFTSKLWNT